uniref:Uncharacterized protein n=1 Tax=Arundo donax TaxID=35708 RepID=A0A0A8XQE4_ARUDO
MMASTVNSSCRSLPSNPSNSASDFCWVLERAALTRNASATTGSSLLFRGAAPPPPPRPSSVTALARSELQRLGTLPATSGRSWCVSGGPGAGSSGASAGGRETSEV